MKEKSQMDEQTVIKEKEGEKPVPAGKNTEMELEAHIHEMELFTMALSHELKNSLSKIRAAVTLASEESMSASLDNYVRVISRASRQMENTITSLNELIKFKHYTGVVKTINPLAIFKEIQNEFLEKFELLHSTINTELTPSTTLKYIDIYFRTILNNLVSNAIKYAYPNRPLQLLVTEMYKDGYYVLTFRDNGAGIDLTDGAAKLFQPFSRLNYNTEGAGLGLHIIKSMIERNGGRIEVESAPGVGTVFTCYLREY